MIERDYPHKEWIRENGTVTIPSVFMFKGGAIELFPFLLGCQKNNCTVIFANEDLIVYPDDRLNDVSINLALSIYASIAKNDNIVKQYIRYLTDIASKNEEVI